jgi:hypothetical protein
MPIVAAALAPARKKAKRPSAKGDQLGGQLWGQLGDQLGGQLAGQLGGQLGGQLWDQLAGQLGGQLWDQLRGQLWDQLGGQLGDQLGDQLWGQLRGQLGGQLNYRFAGHTEVYWIAFYRFCEEIGVAYGPREHERLGWWEELARHCGWCWPFGKVVIASDRPTRTRWNAAHRLHAEDGPAIEFSDGYALYALNGVRVPKELVTTPGADLNPETWILKQGNAEVRREAVRKIGIERVCQQLGAKVIDRQGDVYELLELSLRDHRRRPYLKMRNPSIGVFHIEGVHPDCRTVEAALQWRNGTAIAPSTLT